jgi:hypothetical protein
MKGLTSVNTHATTNQLSSSLFPEKKTFGRLIEMGSSAE